MLISLRKPDEERLVGRVNVDLAQVINNRAYNEPDTYPLSFCSMKDASLAFSVVCL